MDFSQVWKPITDWISGPYRELAIKFIAFFIVVSGLDLALAYLPGYIERRRGARFSKWVDEYNNPGR